MTIAAEQSGAARVVAAMAIIAVAALYLYVRRRRGRNRGGHTL